MPRRLFRGWGRLAEHEAAVLALGHFERGAKRGGKRATGDHILQRPRGEGLSVLQDHRVGKAWGDLFHMMRDEDE